MPGLAVVLGLLVAIAYGCGDFFGGMGAKRNPPTLVVAVSQACGLAALAGAVAVDRGADPLRDDLVAGAAAGTVGMIGVVLLYRGLALGAMSVIAPVTAVGAAVLPLAWGLLTGERPSALALTGVGLALAAVAIVSVPADEKVVTDGPGRASELSLALGAGAAFGAVFILLGTTDEVSGLWPVLAARVASVTLMSAFVLLTGRRLRVERGTFGTVAAAGFLDVLANSLYVVATRRGLLSLVSVLSSLYPAATVLLARITLGETMSTRQLGGIALALGGVALIATG